MTPKEFLGFLDSNGFSCTKCSQSLTPSTLIESVVTYGLIQMESKKDFLLGWSCPSCKGTTTNLIKLSKHDFKIISALIYEWIGPLSRKGLCYRTNGFDCDSIWKIVDVFEAFHVDTSIPIANILEHLDCEETKPTAPYCSFINNTSAIKHDIIPVVFCDFDQAKNLIKLQNEKGVALLPRYITDEDFYSTIDEFCDGYGIDQRYPEFPEADARRLQNLNTEEVIVSKNFNFIKTLAHNTLSWTIIKLCKRNFESCISTPDGVDNQEPSSDESFLTDIDMHTIHFTYSPLRDKVWSSFRSDWMQRLLSTSSDRFILDCQKISKRSDSSIFNIVDLQKELLNNLSKLIQSPNEQRTARNIVSVKLKRNVEDIEEQYPALKAIVSQDDTVNNLKFEIARYASRHAKSLLILGKSGTGKELFARAFHEICKPGGKLIAVNCSALPKDLIEGELFGSKRGAFSDAIDRKGYVEKAAGGTLFLDEIGELPLDLQPKLLRLIENRTFWPLGGTSELTTDATFIFATNRDLDEEVHKGCFRQDLLARIKSLSINIPPLCERRSDIPILIEHFLRRFRKESGNSSVTINQECLDYLIGLDWPENIRGLSNAIYAMVFQADPDAIISINDLPEYLVQAKPVKKTTENPVKRGRGRRPAFTKEQLLEAYEKANHVKKNAANLLKCSEPTLHRAWARYSLPS
jgi:DNA-binding NtrC family response regulator